MVPKDETPNKRDDDSARLEAGEIRNPSTGVSRRRFGTTVAAGGLYTMLHQALGTADVSAQAGRSELCEMSAVELAARLARKEVSAREVMAAHLARIERVNPKVNAIVTLVADQAMAGAAKADEAIMRRDPIGVLHGLPVAHKDLVDTAGIRTTRGSPFYRDNVPTRDALHRDADPRGRRHHRGQDEHARVRRRIADLQYRLRCHAQSVRPDEDLRRQQRRRGDGCGCPDAADRRWQRRRRLAPQSARVLQRRRTAALAGPRAERVHLVVAVLGGRADCANGRRCRALSQRDCRTGRPESTLDPGRPRAFSRAARRDFKGVRVAWWRGLGGIPFEPEIRRVVDANRKVFEDLGCVVEEAEPDFTGVDEAFPLLRFVGNHPQIRAARPAAAGVGEGHDQIRSG